MDNDRIVKRWIPLLVLSGATIFLSFLAIAGYLYSVFAGMPST